MTPSRCPRCGAERADAAQPCPVCALPPPPTTAPPQTFWPAAPTSPPPRDPARRRVALLAVLVTAVVTAVVTVGLLVVPGLLDDEPGERADPPTSTEPTPSPTSSPTPSPTPTPTPTPTPAPSPTDEPAPTTPAQDRARQRRQAGRTALSGLQAWTRVLGGDVGACRAAVRATVLGERPQRRCRDVLGTSPGVDLRLSVVDVALRGRRGSVTMRFVDRSRGAAPTTGRVDHPLVLREGRWLLDFRRQGPVGRPG